MNKIEKQDSICAPLRLTFQNNNNKLKQMPALKAIAHEAGIEKKKSKNPKDEKWGENPKLATSRTAAPLGTPLPRIYHQSCAAANAEVESESVFDIDAE